MPKKVAFSYFTQGFTIIDDADVEDWFAPSPARYDWVQSGYTDYGGFYTQSFIDDAATHQSSTDDGLFDNRSLASIEFYWESDGKGAVARIKANRTQSVDEPFYFRMDFCYPAAN